MFGKMSLKSPDFAAIVDGGVFFENPLMRRWHAILGATSHGL